MRYRVFEWERRNRRRADFDFYRKFYVLEIAPDSWAMMLAHYRWLRKSGLYPQAARLTWLAIYDKTYSPVRSIITGKLPTEAPQ